MMFVRHCQTGLILIAFTAVVVAMPSGLLAETPSHDDMVAMALQAFDDRLYGQAESYGVAFLEKFPNSPHRVRMRYLLGRTYFLQGRFVKAREAFLTLINDDEVCFSDQADGLFWLAESCAQLDRWEEAKAYYVEFVSKTSDSPFLEKSLFTLGLICLEEKLFSGAEAYLSNAVMAYPRGRYVAQAQYYRGLIYAHWKNYHRAVQLLREAMFAPSGLPDPLRRDCLFQLGENRLRLGQFRLALTYYREFCQTFPEDARTPFALYGAGWCQVKTGQGESALVFFQELIRRFPKSDPYRFALFRTGEIHLEQDHFEKARDAFGRIVKEYPESELVPQALVSLGWCHLNLGDWDAVIEIAHRLLKLPSGQVEKALPQLLLGEAHFQRAQYKEALPYYFSLLNTPSQRESALYKISRCYFFLEEYKDAITNVEILSLEYPDSDYLQECLYVRGKAAYQLGETEKAAASFLEIVKQEKDDSWTVAASYELGKIYYERKDLNRAKDFFARITQTAPRTETAILASYYLGIIYTKEDNSGDALRSLHVGLESENATVAAECHYRIGEIYLERKAYYLSLHHFQTIVDTLADQPGWVELALFQIGNVRLLQGDAAEADRIFRRVLEESKDSDLREASEKMLASIATLKPKP
jgi:TolA-binding protein